MVNNDCIDCTDSMSESSENTFQKDIAGERIGGPESSMPPLPEPITVPGGGHDPRPGDDAKDGAHHTIMNILKEGCYYMRLMPTSLHTPARFQYEGTMRFQRNGRTIIASGDLYKKDFCQSPTYCPSFSVDGESRNKIPVFPRKHYAYYLRITHIEADREAGRDIRMQLNPYRFQQGRHAWNRSEALTAKLKTATAPDGVQFWTGHLQTRSGVVMGHLEVVYISPFLRQAVVEIDKVPEAQWPLENENGEGWNPIFKKAGWDVSVEASDADVAAPDDRSWSNSELHKKMLEYRGKNDLDKEWRYHLLAVKHLDDKEAFGVMYDNTVYGANDIPREGAAIASHIVFPEGEGCWGKCCGKRFDEAGAPYFRTAVHEIGHAMMLYHPDNPYENYIMQKTVRVAHNAVSPVRFPDNIQWSFSPRDIRMLCHLPDIAIRPGGVSFGTPHHRLPVNVRDEVIDRDGLELEVSALNPVVPIGAPVRVNFSLKNRSGGPKQVPNSLSMKTGHVSGRVIDPLGNSQEFATIVRYTGNFSMRDLAPGEDISHAVTMLWGTQGPLFPTSGFYRVLMELNWYDEGVRVRCAGSTNVMVTPPKDDEHAEIALKIFSSPRTLMALAVGGDHLEEGYKGIKAALSHPALRPHYNLVEAKRVGQRYFERQPDLETSFKLVDEGTVMSPVEVIRLTKILRNFAPEAKEQTVKKMLGLLLNKGKEYGIEDKLLDIIKEIKVQ